jgi:hypothetical protein
MLLQKDLCWFEVPCEMWALASAPYLGRKLGDWFMCKCTSKSGRTLIQMHPNLEGGCNIQYNMENTCQSTCLDTLKLQWCEIHCKLGQFWAMWPMWPCGHPTKSIMVYRDIYTMACAPSFDWKMCQWTPKLVVHSSKCIQTWRKDATYIITWN